MPDLVKQRAEEISIGAVVGVELLCHGRLEGVFSNLEQLRVHDDVLANQDRSSVLARDIALVGQDSGRVGAACLTEVRDDLVDTERDVLADALVVFVRHEVLELL